MLHSMLQELIDVMSLPEETYYASELQGLELSNSYHSLYTTGMRSNTSHDCYWLNDRSPCFRGLLHLHCMVLRGDKDGTSRDCITRKRAYYQKKSNKSQKLEELKQAIQNPN